MYTHRRLATLLVITILFLLGTETVIAQSKPSGRVDGINPDHSSVLGLVGHVLKDRNMGVWSVEATTTNDILSSYLEFRSHLLPYRARFRFHVEGTSLVVTMEDLQSPGKGTWTRSIIPADGAEAKLIAQMVDRLNAAVANSSARLVTVPSSNAVSAIQNHTESEFGHRGPAKTMVFDSLPVRCAEGMCPVRRDGLWGFLDYDGNLVLDFQYQVANSVPYFSEGACAVHAAGSNNRPLPGYVYIDKKGKLLFNGRVFDAAGPFVGGVAVVDFTEKIRNERKQLANVHRTGVLDREGNIALIEGLAAERGFHDGLIVARGDTSNFKLGFRDVKGRWAIPPAYEEVQAFSDGVAWVAQTTVGGVRKWGGINTKGQVVIPFQFSRKPERFSDGLARVQCSDDTKGYVDMIGALVLPCRYREAHRFVHGRAYVADRRGYLLIDKHGNVLADAKHIGVSFNEIKFREDGIFEYVAAYTGALDENWRPLIAAKFEDIFLFPDDGAANGVAWATLPGRTPKHPGGFINRQGEFVVMQQENKF